MSDPTWQQNLIGGFSSENAPFAVQSLDERRALDALKQCVEADVAIEEVMSVVDDHFEQRIPSKDRKPEQLTMIDQQKERVRVRFAGWLRSRDE